MLSGNGLRLYKNQRVHISLRKQKEFNLANSVGVIIEHPSSHQNSDQLVAVLLDGDDHPIDLHAKSLLVIR